MFTLLTLNIGAGTEEEVHEAAEEIAAFVAADTTEPRAEDHDAWLSDRVLRGTLEKFGRETGRWELIPPICDRAELILTQIQPRTDQILTGRVLVLLMAFNAARRCCRPNTAQVNALRIQIEKAFWPLESREDPRTRRLRTLCYYHSAIWERSLGNYTSAANFHHLALEEAEKADDYISFAIALLCEEVERNSGALAEGHEYSLEALMACAQGVVAACRDSADPIIRNWALYNAPVHVLLAHIWRQQKLSTKEMEGWRSLIEKLKAVDPTAYSAVEATITAVDAGIAMLSDHDGEARRLSDHVLNSSTTNHQARMTARWVLACITPSPIMWKHHLEQLLAPEHDMHQLRAAAQRKLAIRERKTT